MPSSLKYSFDFREDGVTVSADEERQTGNDERSNCVGQGTLH